MAILCVRAGNLQCLFVVENIVLDLKLKNPHFKCNTNLMIRSMGGGKEKKSSLKFIPL